MSGSLSIFPQEPSLVRSGVAPAKQDLYFEARFPRPRSSVFFCWTIAEYMELFCNTGTSSVRAIAKPEVGSPFSITAQRHGYPLFRIEGVYRAIDPPSRIACTWNFTSAQMSFESSVDFELIESGSGTTLQITQLGITSDRHREMQSRWWSEVLWRMTTLFR